MSRAWKRNFLWWFGVAVVGLLVNAAVCYQNLITLVETSRRLVHSQMVLNHIEDTISTVKDAETGQRGYLLTGRPAYLTPYRQALQRIDADLRELRDLTADQPFFRERLPRLEKAIHSKLDELEKTIKLHDEKGPEAARQEVLTDRGKEDMEVVRTVSAELVNEETGRVGLREKQAESTASLARYSFTLATVVDLLLVAVVATLIQRNVARQERDAEALRQSEEQLRLLVEGARDYALVFLDREGKIASWNGGAEQLFGYRATSIIGQHYSRFFPPDVEKDLPAKHLAAAAKGRGEELGWRVRADGSRFWADAVLTALRDRNASIRGYALLTRDMTERRRAEEALRASESRFRRLADANLIGVVAFDLQGRVWEANDAFLSTVGRSRDELLSGAVRLDTLTPPEQTARDAEVTERLRADGVAPPFEKEYLRKDGSRVPVLVGAARLEGTADRCVGFVLDLTERKKAEEEIRLLNTSLEQRVVERTRQLQESNQELESFSYSVSHDLRAPLRHISGFADLLQKRLGGSLDEMTRRYARVITEAAHNAGKLVDELLAFSRMGRTELKKVPVKMGELALQVVRELEVETEGRDVRWTVEPLPTVPGDATMLRQVMRNLLNNALKYTRGRSPAEIHVGALTVPPDAARPEVTVFVRDNGVGFDMRYVDKLFGVFQRLHTAEQFEGTGIGLANVRRIVARHGGETRAEGEPGKGATFYFTLPLGAAEGRT